MSTRSILGRPDGEGITGVYHHSDGYPSGIGVYTFRLLRHKYHGDVDAFLADVVDAHPVGWSHLFPSEHSLVGSGPNDGECYCHTRGETDAFRVTTLPDGDDGGTEYAYSFDAFSRLMGIMMRHGEEIDGEWITTWRPLAIVDLDGPEPDWWKMDGMEPNEDGYGKTWADEFFPSFTPEEARLLTLV